MKALYILAALAVAGPVQAQPTMKVFDTINGVSYDCPGDPRCLTTRASLPHRYTVAEIDRMRVIVMAKTKCNGGGCSLHTFELLSYTELRLQTLIAAGTTIEELESAP